MKILYGFCMHHFLIYTEHRVIMFEHFFSLSPGIKTNYVVVQNIILCGISVLCPKSTQAPVTFYILLCNVLPMSFYKQKELCEGLI